MLKILHTILLFSLLSACSSLPSTSVILIDEDVLSEKIEVSEIQSGTTATGTLKAWGDIKNLTKENLMIEVRTSTLGDRRQALEKAGSWTRVFIKPNSTSHFELLSAEKAAEEFVLEMREGNK
ncbi:MAG: hypothetical protein HOP24_11950 [Sideroxydans sp.]|nr:hypothetical protein [Sideroxydans sp.]